MDAASQRMNDLHQLLGQANQDRDTALTSQRELRARIKQLDEQLQLATDADDAIMSNVNQTVGEVRRSKDDVRSIPSFHCTLTFQHTYKPHHPTWFLVEGSSWRERCRAGCS